MYSHFDPNYIMVNTRRVAFGATSSIRDSGNPNLCASGESCKTSASNDSPSSSGSSGTPKKSSNLPLILGIAIPAFLLFWGIVIVCVCVSTNKRRREAIGAIGTGQAGMANMPNGAQQRVQMMNGQMADKFGEVVMNQFEVNVEEQATPDYQQQTAKNNQTKTDLCDMARANQTRALTPRTQTLAFADLLLRLYIISSQRTALSSCSHKGYF
ncbi:hypothetical protein ACLB2K_021913 [Fragaria x ananassa]